jgi:hypothetical protein
MPEILIYRPIIQQLRKYAILSAFILLFMQLSAMKAPDSCLLTPDSLDIQPKLLLPNKPYTPEDTSVVMTLPVFTTFYLARKQADTLKRMIPAFEMKIKHLNTAYQQTIHDYQQIMFRQQSMISNNKAVIENKDKEMKILNRKLKFQKIKTGVTGGLGVLTIIAIIVL